jgi:hypothetical protein
MLYSLIKFCIKAFLFTCIYLWSFGLFIHFYPYVLLLLTQYIGGASSRTVPLPTSDYTNCQEGAPKGFYKFYPDEL